MSENICFPVIMFWRREDGGLKTEFIPQVSIASDINHLLSKILPFALKEFNIPIDPDIRFDAFWLDTDSWITDLSQKPADDWDDRPLVAVDHRLREGGTDYFRALMFTVPQYQEFIATAKAHIVNQDKADPNQININGNVSGSTIIIGNKNKVQRGQKSK